jgi:hypothetical protein
MGAKHASVSWQTISFMTVRRPWRPVMVWRMGVKRVT